MADLLPLGSEFQDKTTGLRLRVTGYAKDAYGRPAEQVVIAETPPEAPNSHPKSPRRSSRPRPQFTVDTPPIMPARRKPSPVTGQEDRYTMVWGFLSILV